MHARMQATATVPEAYFEGEIWPNYERHTRARFALHPLALRLSAEAPHAEVLTRVRDAINVACAATAPST